MSHTENQIKHNEKQKAKKEARRHKVCCWCQKTYIDNTKRTVGKTCSKDCAYSYGVAARRENGSYKRTEEQNEKLSKTLKEQYASGDREITVNQALDWWKIATEEQKKQRIENRKKTVTKKSGVGHWSQTIEGRKRISEIHSGKHVPPERMKALSQAAMKSHNMHSRSKKGIREDLGCFFRSTWEANYARYLNRESIKWKYESITYNLGPTKSYTPDFILEDGTHVEIKGWLTEKGAEKLRLFQEQYPEIKLEIVDKVRYTVINKQYQFLIPNWEK